MTLLTGDKTSGLVKTNDPFQANASITHEGMASWAATGPAGRSCRDCASFGTGKQGRPDKPTTKSGCRKWLELMNAKAAKTFPADTRACRYFEKYTGE